MPEMNKNNPIETMSKNEEKTVGACNAGVVTLDDFAVRFSGDSGDGMQLAGNIFSTVSAIAGNDICTFPNYPADIRAPLHRNTDIARQKIGTEKRRSGKGQIEN